MKIYQLHEYSGEYEDFCDHIIGSYLRKERAEEEKAKSEAEERELVEQSNKCNDCPYLYDACISNDELLSYCSKAELEECDGDVDCNNYFYHWNRATFNIEEVEVEE